MGLALQYAVVAAIVAACAWIAFVKQMPASARRLRVAIALPLLREGRPPWLRRAGRLIAPPSTAAGHCGAGCDSCKPPSPSP